MERSRREKMPNDARDRQRQEQRSIGLIINSIVHSFNNAVGLIRGYADLSLRATEPDSRIYPYLKNIIDGADSLKELSEKMRLLGKQEKRDLKLMPIHSIVEEAIHSLPMSRTLLDKIQTSIDPTCGAIFADAGQIRQTMIHLCDNAYDAIRDNGGVVEVVLKEVDVDLSFAQAHRGLQEGRYLKLTVKDTGSGMAPEVLGQIFDPFFTTREAGEHAGLGLTVVQEIVKHHKATITVDSQLGEGTVFNMYFPYSS